jgi:hypothetical protein
MPVEKKITKSRELIDLPFPVKRYRLRIDGEWATKLPQATKTEVMQKLREWWVAH